MVELRKDPSPDIRRRELLLFIDDCKIKIRNVDLRIDEFNETKNDFLAMIQQAENEIKCLELKIAH
jgi:hypothetical protein